MQIAGAANRAAGSSGQLCGVSVCTARVPSATPEPQAPRPSPRARAVAADRRTVPPAHRHSH